MTSPNKGIEFSKLVLLSLAVILSGFTAILVYAFYQFSQVTVDNDLNVLKGKHDSIVRLILASRERDIETTIETLTASSAVQQALQSGDQAILQDKLEQVYEDKELGHLDILFTFDANHSFLVDATDERAISDAIYEDLLNHRNVEFRNTVKRLMVDGQIQYVLITHKNILDRNSGKVIGSMTGGISLNDNHGLAYEISSALGGQQVSFISRDGPLVSYPQSNLEKALKDESTFSRFLVDDHLFHSLDVYAGPSDQWVLSVSSELSFETITQQRNRLIDTVWISGVFITVFSVIGSLLFKRFADRSLKSLTGYAEHVLEGDRTSQYSTTQIQEFNAVGDALEHFVHQLDSSEERFRDFANSGADWFWEQDTEQRFTYIDGQIESILGLRAEEVIGQTRLELHDAERNRASMEKIQEAVRKREPFSELEILWHVGDEEKYLSLSGKPRFVEGIYLGYRGVGRDISLRKRAYEEAIELRHKAEEANSAKSEFLASMSHELRTPLNAVLGFTQVLQLDRWENLNDSQREYLSDIELSGNQLLSLVNQILDLSAIEAHQVESRLEQVNLSILVGECLKLIQTNAQKRNLSIQNLVSGLGNITVQTDPAKLKQVIINLLANAVKYNHDNGRIIVKAELVQDSYVRLIVSDTGIGIKGKNREKVFNMFGRLDENAYESKDSIGIGLAVSKHLMEILAGDIDFTTNAEEGCDFYIDVPLVTNKRALFWKKKYVVKDGTQNRLNVRLISGFNKFYSRLQHGSVNMSVLDDLYSLLTQKLDVMLETENEPGSYEKAKVSKFKKEIDEAYRLCALSESDAHLMSFSHTTSAFLTWLFEARNKGDLAESNGIGH